MELTSGNGAVSWFGLEIWALRAGQFLGGQLWGMAVQVGLFQGKKWLSLASFCILAWPLGVFGGILVRGMASGWCTVGFWSGLV